MELCWARLGWVLGLLVAMSAGATASAQAPPAADGGVEPAYDPSGYDAEARGLFEAGRAAYSDGRFADALEHFRRAYELSERPQLLFNIANTSERLRRDDEALEAYERYLEQVPDAHNRSFVEQRIAALRDSGARRPGEAPAETEAEIETETETETGDAPAAPAPDDEGSWWSGRPILGPALLGGVGLVGLGVVVGSYAAEGCEVRGPSGCLQGDRVAAGPTAAWGLLGVAALAGGVVWLLLGGDGGEADEPSDAAGVGPAGLWYRRTF